MCSAIRPSRPDWPLFRLPWGSDREMAQLRAELKPIPQARRINMRSLGVNVVCGLDGLANSVLWGWASAGPNAPPAKLRLLIDGEEVGKVLCSEDRPDVHSAGLALKSGFRYSVPYKFRDGRLHMLQMRSDEGRSLSFLVDGVARAEAGFRLKDESGSTAARLAAAVADNIRGMALPQTMAQKGQVSP